MDSKKLYIYDGPVELFDACIDQKWTAETYAVSEKKALSQLKYRYKREYGLVANARINLPGEIKEA